MGAQATNVIHVGMDVSRLGEEGLKTLVSGILQTASQSTLYASSPVVQACVAALSVASAKHQAAEDAVIAAEAKLEVEKQNAIDAWLALMTSLVQYRRVVETTATSATDVTAAGFTPLTRAAPGAIAIPHGIDVFYPKKRRGRAKVTVQGEGRNRRYGAQICLDPLTQSAWTDLDGDGRSHWLTGYPSGTVVWVRFRAVRGHAKSDWCSPVCITIP